MPGSGTGLRGEEVMAGISAVPVGGRLSRTSLSAEIAPAVTIEPRSITSAHSARPAGMLPLTDILIERSASLRQAAARHWC